MKVSVSVLSLAVMAVEGSSGAFVPNPPGFSAVDFPVHVPRQGERCPPKCNGNVSDAKRYSNPDEFSACNGTISFNYENLFDVNSHAVIACTEVEENVANAMNDFVGENVSTVMSNSVVFTAPSRCMTAVNLPKDLNLGWWGNNRPEWKDSAVAIGNEMRNYMRDSNRCNEMSSFKNQGTTFGAIWAGSMIQNNGVAATLITYLIDKISQDGMPNAKYLQWCGDGDPAKTTGIIIDASGNKEAVRQAMQQWSMGKCWNTKTGESTLSGKDLWFFDYADLKNGNPANDGNLGTCIYKTIASGDDMAIKCGITGDALKLYNPGVNLNNLQIGQILCCSAGRMPDLRPKPNPDGSCKVHTVASGDSCDVIRAKYYPLSIDELMSFNSNTYGWMGCTDGHPWTNTNICVSGGNPPRPVANVLAECGPLAPGDKYDSECPLKACCSKDGFCGIGGVHCAKVSSPTGAPGTTGCFSNCDTGYVQGPAPVSFIKVGYYESWSVGWKCMNGGFDAIDWSKYTHIHFSFADIGTDLYIKMDANATSEFDKFKQVVGSKKIVSFGGWGISTDVSTYQHLRNAMLPSNVDAVVDNLINWMTANNLDGLDIDWEYPGAPDIPSIPPGLPSDGPNYLNFLRKLKAKMPVGKSLSIAAPASYWYLKNFPIADMAPLLDYIVYMTYDLHGQWDYGNKWTGNFLKSHVDWTETYQALALITKAGVPSNKVLFGLGAYGRSFQQVDPNCSDATCRFTGPDSGATPGECTGAAGYLSLAEINKIIASGSFRRHYPDNISGSDILLYGTDQWVAWIPEPAMKAREEWARSVNLGGSVLWAADLVKESSLEEDEWLNEPLFNPKESCVRDIEAFDDIDILMAEDEASLDYLKCKGVEIINPMCYNYAAARASFKMVNNSLSKYNYLKSNNYETIFKDYYQPKIYEMAVESYNDYMFAFTSSILSLNYVYNPVNNFSRAEIPVSLEINYVEKAENGSFSSSLNELLTKSDELMSMYWAKHLGYSSYNDERLSSGALKREVIGIYLKNEEEFLKKISTVLGFQITMGIFKWGELTMNMIKDCSGSSGNICNGSHFKFDRFPIIDKDLLIPDPMGSIEGNITDIIDFNNKLDKSTTIWDEDPTDIVVGSRLPLMSLVFGIDSMFSAYDTGLKYKRIDEIEKENALISFIMGIIFMLMSFVPGMGIIATLGEFVVSAIMGNLGNPFDVIVTAAGFAGDLFKVIKGVDGFASAASKAGKISNIAEINKIIGSNKAMAKRINKVESKFMC